LVLVEALLIVFSIVVKRPFGLFYMQNVLVYVVFLFGFWSVWHGFLCNNNAKAELVLAQIFYVMSFIMVLIQSVSGAIYLYFFTYYMQDNCRFLFGCDPSQISLAIKVLVPVILIGDIAFVILSWYFLRAIFKFIKAAENYHTRYRVLKIIHRVGVLLEFSRVCSRGGKEKKRDKTMSSDNEIKERQASCNCRFLGCKCFCTKGTVGLTLLIIFTSWIALNGVICLLAGRNTNHNGWRVFCVLFNAIMSMSGTKCPGCEN